MESIWCRRFLLGRDKISQKGSFVYFWNKDCCGRRADAGSDSGSRLLDSPAHEVD